MLVRKKNRQEGNRRPGVGSVSSLQKSFVGGAAGLFPSFGIGEDHLSSQGEDRTGRPAEGHYDLKYSDSSRVRLDVDAGDSAQVSFKGSRSRKECLFGTLKRSFRKDVLRLYLRKASALYTEAYNKEKRELAIEEDERPFCIRDTAENVSVNHPDGKKRTRRKKK